MSTHKENIRRGHRNQENGAYFEKMLGQLFTRMADGELARIAKVPEPLRGLCQLLHGWSLYQMKQKI